MAGGRLAELELTDEQRQKLEDVHYRQLKKVIPMQSELRLAALDLRHLMHAENPDARAIDAQIDRIASMRANVGKARVASLLEARAILTPEQRKMWRDHAAMGGMRGMRGGPGGPGARGRRDMMMRHGQGGGGGGGGDDDGPEGHDL
jgi:Spy/CpxP family protein refolding chaperone